jgi:hypothetical protein
LPVTGPALLPSTTELLPLSDRLSPKTTIKVYGLAPAGRLASVTTVKEITDYALL